MCCDSEYVFLVDGRSWSRSCRLAVGVVGVAGTFSLPLTCVIPHADSCTIVCTVRQRHRYESGIFFAVMAVDCGDEIPSKSKPQPAGVTSYANPANLLSFCCFVFDFQFLISELVTFLQFSCKFHECSTNSSVCKRFSSIFPVSVPELLLNFWPIRDVSYISMLHCATCVFHLSSLIFARPDDLCGSFFFFPER